MSLFKRLDNWLVKRERICGHGFSKGMCEALICDFNSASVIAERHSAYHYLKKELRKDWPKNRKAELLNRQELKEFEDNLGEQWWEDVKPWINNNKEVWW